MTGPSNENRLTESFKKEPRKGGNPKSANEIWLPRLFWLGLAILVRSAIATVTRRPLLDGLRADSAPYRVPLPAQTRAEAEKLRALTPLPLSMSFI